MWVVVGMANSQSMADSMQEFLESEGILVKLRNTSVRTKRAGNAYEILVLESEVESSREILREKGLAIQVKRADKESKEGVICAVASDDGKALAMAEVNCETDFVAKTDNFKAFATAVACKTLSGDEAVVESMQDELVAVVAATGENVKISRVARFASEPNMRIESYIHMGGKVGVLVEVSCEKAEATAHPAVAELIHDLALQVAAASPRFLKSDEIPAADVEVEKDIYRKQMAGKPANILENILKGKIKKFYSEICLVDQAFVKEPKQSVTQVVNAAAKQADSAITITRFVRFQLGAA